MCVCKHVWQKTSACVCVCVLARGAAASRRRGLWFIINNLYPPPSGCRLTRSVALQPFLSLSRLHHPWKHTENKSSNNVFCSSLRVHGFQQLLVSTSPGVWVHIHRFSCCTLTQLEEETAPMCHRYNVDDRCTTMCSATSLVFCVLQIFFHSCQ